MEVLWYLQDSGVCLGCRGRFVHLRSKVRRQVDLTGERKKVSAPFYGMINHLRILAMKPESPSRGTPFQFSINEIFSGSATSSALPGREGGHFPSSQLKPSLSALARPFAVLP